MFKRLYRGLIGLGKQLQGSVRRFPETLVFAAALVGVGITMNHLDYGRNVLMNTLEKDLIVLILGVPLMTAAVLFVERKGWSAMRRLLLDLGIAAALGLYLWLLPDKIDDTDMIQYALLLVAAFLLFSLVPYAFRRKDFSRYVLYLITHFFITILFSLVLFGGLNAIIFTIEQLFEVNITNDIHMDLFILIGGLFSVTHFLASIPGVKEPLEEDYYPPVLRVLYIYIIIPLLSVYTLILYAYFVRLILLREFPINLLGHLVVWYGLISVIILFFVNRIVEENAYLKLFFKWFPLVILIPLAMLFAAIFSRIGDYGITPSRYFVVITGVWILASMLYLRFSKAFKPTYLVAGAMAVLLISAYGPQSAFNLSLNDQTGRFEELLSSYQMLDGQTIIPRTDLTDEQELAIDDFVQYFNRYHGWDKVDLLPADFDYSAMKAVFGFEYAPWYPKSIREVSYFMERETMVMDISGYDSLAYMYLDLAGDMNMEEGDFGYSYDASSHMLTLSWQGDPWIETDLATVLEAYHAARGGLQPQSTEDATIALAPGVMMVINNLYYDLDERDQMNYGSLNCILLLDIDAAR